MDHSLFLEFTLVIGVAAVVGLVGTLLRQPLVVSFIAVGILVGPVGLGLVSDYEQIELLAHMGIALLLFVVGLKLDLQMIRTMGPVALATGMGQVIFTSVFGFLIARALGMELVTSVYVAVALTFSSTIIIVKLLSDKREIDALHGRIAIGFLIVQDIVVVLAMIGLSALGGVGGDDAHLLGQFAVLAGRGLLFLAGVGLMMWVVFPRLMPYVARSTELLLLFSIAWAIALAAVADMLGFSKEVGAFLAGICLGSTPYRDGIGSRMVTLRDFLLLFFFIDLGSRLDLTVLGAQLGNAAIFSAFVLIGNPLVVMIIMGIMGYRKRTGFLAGLTVAQISEFSLILAALGMSLGHINEQTMGLVTLVGLITIGTSTYMIIYSGPLYGLLARFLSIFERRVPYRETDSGNVDELPRADVVLFGLGSYGGPIARHLLEHGKRVVGVDFDPETLRAARIDGLATLYGDVEDPELFDHLPLERARWVMSALPDLDSNLALLKSMRERDFDGRVVLSARTRQDAYILEQAGPDLVLYPFIDAAEMAADSLTEAMDAFTRETPWPFDVREVRLRPGSVYVGQTIAEMPLRAETGASILAVSRSGRSHFDPGPEFRLHAGDRLVLLGEPENLQHAVEYLDRRQSDDGERIPQQFSVSELQVSEDAPWVDKTLAELDLRRNNGVTVIGIQRGERRITAPTATETIQAGDILLIAGTNEAMGACGEMCRAPRNDAAEHRSHEQQPPGSGQ